MESEPIIFSGSASRGLTKEICDYLGLPAGKIETSQFSDGETRVKINENVRGADVFVLQSTYTPVNEHLMELLLIIDALKRASANRINAVVPYFGYARQDRKDEGRVALSAKLVANLITVAGANRVITVDLHAGQIQGFFDIPVDHLIAGPLIVDYVKGLRLENSVVVSPDVGNVKMARNYAQRLDSPLAIIDKRRPQPNVSEVMTIIGEIAGKHVFMFDDMIDTGGTIVNAAVALKEKGAREVYACCTHPVFSDNALERIHESPLAQILVSNSIPTKDKAPLDKIKTISLAPLIGEAIRRIHNNLSVSSLFD